MADFEDSESHCEAKTELLNLGELSGGLTNLLLVALLRLGTRPNHKIEYPSKLG